MLKSAKYTLVLGLVVILFFGLFFCPTMPRPKVARTAPLLSAAAGEKNESDGKVAKLEPLGELTGPLQRQVRLQPRNTTHYRLQRQARFENRTEFLTYYGGLFEGKSKGREHKWKSPNPDEDGHILDFAIIGFAKCGTTSMEANLRQLAPMPVADIRHERFLHEHPGADPPGQGQDQNAGRSASTAAKVIP